MNIVIAGAGDIGFHLAKLLTIENQNITLIDLDSEVLQYIDTHLDVLTIQGDAASLEVLTKAKIHTAHLFIAVTTNETTNLLASILAKRLGAKKTIARVSKAEYAEDTSKAIFKEMGIDTVISPRILAALEIERLMQHNIVSDFLAFEDGLISIIGFPVHGDSPLIDKDFKVLHTKTEEFGIKPICILRNGITSIPTEDLKIEKNDHIYLSINTEDLSCLDNYVQKPTEKIKSIMIIGDSPLALRTAQLLEDRFSVTMVGNNEDRCKEMLAVLNNVLIIHGDWGNIELLKEEGLERIDAFIALTDNAETNIITCITAEQMGVNKTVALVDNSAYIHVSQSIGIDTLINKQIIAANNIFKYVRKGKVEAIASMHGVTGEIIEFEIHKKNRVINVPISKLYLPPGAAKIVGVVRDKKGIIPQDDFQLKIGDKVIVFALPHVIKKVERIF